MFCNKDKDHEKFKSGKAAAVNFGKEIFKLNQIKMYFIIG